MAMNYRLRVPIDHDNYEESQYLSEDDLTRAGELAGKKLSSKESWELRSKICLAFALYCLQSKEEAGKKFIPSSIKKEYVDIQKDCSRAMNSLAAPSCSTLVEDVMDGLRPLIKELLAEDPLPVRPLYEEAYRFDIDCEHKVFDSERSFHRFVEATINRLRVISEAAKRKVDKKEVYKADNRRIKVNKGAFYRFLSDLNGVWEFVFKEKPKPGSSTESVEGGGPYVKFIYEIFSGLLKKYKEETKKYGYECFPKNISRELSKSSEAIRQCLMRLQKYG